MNRATQIYELTHKLFPNAGCELIYNNPFELLVAVALSAQTTDKSVNKITGVLFSKYPDSCAMKEANFNDIYEIIKPIGLAQTKTKNIIKLSDVLATTYNGQIPDELEELMKLPGVGRKTANVVLATAFNKPRIAVDTHVKRVSIRLGIAKEGSSELEIENKLMQDLDESLWTSAHHSLLFFGRYCCLAKKPMCNKCLLKEYCCYNES